jgi:hypothetical protein
MINIVSTFYTTSNEQRNMELTATLLKNVESPIIEKIHLFIDDVDALNILISLTKHTDKISIIEGYKKPLYSDFFRYILKNVKGKLCMITNADIYISSYEEQLLKALYKNKWVYALTRHEHDMSCPLIDRYFGSHDCYIFNSEFIDASIINYKFTEFYQNLVGIESRIISAFIELNFTAYNPCKQIQIVHLHESNFRTWNVEDWVGLHPLNDDDALFNSCWYVPPKNLELNAKPSSFSTICTSVCAHELIGLLLSLSIYHTNEKIYILADSKTKYIIDNITPKPKLKIIWFIELDEYDNFDRTYMVHNNIWSKFQMNKANIIKKTLEFELDTLFLDSDIIITDTIENVNKFAELGLSPQFINDFKVKETGYYNGGMLWTNNKSVPDDWNEFTKTSRYFDQASIEDLAKKYKYFEFDENYNLQCWRLYYSEDGKDKIKSYLTSVPNDKVYYKSKPLKFIHTHFNNSELEEFNSLLISHFKNAKMYKILAIIYRVINNKWVLKIPKQPMDGIYHHINDSYRELVHLIEKNNNDVVVIEDNTTQCWLEPNLLTYDRDTLMWINAEVEDASLIFLGNCDTIVEGAELRNLYKNTIVQPWIYWPRRPTVLENLIETNEILSYENRNIETIFIGNYENSVQELYRNTNVDWKSAIEFFYCTQGGTHIFSNEEYLLKLMSSKYGLCLRGYGKKCHREIELMALGTIPIITNECVIFSYADPPVENVHFITANNPEDIKNKLKNITKEQWELMSKSCVEWYKKNVYSKNGWVTMINNILYSNFSA